MGYNTLSQSGHTGYGIKEFVVYTDEDIKTLPIDVPMGSAALVIDSGNVYMMDSQDEWKPLPT